MKKRNLVIISVLTAAVVLAGCSNSAKTAGQAGNPGEQKEQTGSQNGQAGGQSGQNSQDTGSGQAQKAGEKPAKAVKLRVGIGATADSALGKGVEYFGKLLDEKSGGSIQVELCAGSVLGGDRETIEGVGMGTFEMCNIATGPIANFSEKFLAMDLPYVVTDRETAYAALDGEKGRDVLDSLENTGIYGLNFWELGFRDLYNAKKIITHPEDLKGMKIRVMENDVYISLFNGLGAYATPMSIGEVFTSLQQGTIDGHDNPIGPTLTGKFYEADKNCTKTHHVYSATVSMINREFFDSLPEEYQKWIVEADAEARDYERKLVLEEEEESYKAWEAAGGTVTDVDMDEWAAACAFVIEDYKDKLDMDFVNALRGQ